MKAITCSRYGSEGVLQLSKVGVPKITASELLVKVYSASVNPVDWKIRSGQIIAKTGFRPPKILGSDFAGTIAEVGNNITNYKVGDKVWGKVDSFKGGSYAEYIKVTGQNISHIPQGIKNEEAASIPNVGLTAYQALINKAGLRKGDHVLVNGASGGVGLMAVQIAKAMGCTVTGVCSGKNAELVKKLGADYVVDYTSENITPHKNTYDVFFDSVANLSLLKVISTLQAGGVYVRTTPSLESLLLGPVLGLFRLKRVEHIMVKPSHEDLVYLKKLVETKQLVATIDSTYEMKDIAEAHKKSKTGRVVGKLVLKIAQS